MEPERIRHEWPDGSPRLEAWQRNGHYVGEYRTYSKRGTLEQHVCYDDDGLPHGEAVVFNAELQRLQELSFDRGMVEVPASRLEALGKRLADPAVYAPDVLGPVAPQAHHKQLLWGLWRRGHLALGGLPGRWRDLADDVRGVGADDVLALLRESVDAPQDMLRLQVRVLPYWTFDMDRLVMQVAARDVAPFLAALPDLPMPLRDGVRTALRRLGVPAETTGPFEGDLAVELARQQVEGLFQASVLRQGKVVTVELRNPGPTEHWDPFVASLVDPADVRRHLVDAVVVAQRSELSIDHVDEAWRHAEGTAEVVAFCRKLGPPYGDPLGHVHRVLSTREDGPDALLELADAFGQANMEAWQQGALLYALARGADPSVASRLTFTAWREPGAPLEAVARVEERWFPILDTVPRDALQAALGKRLGSAYVVGGLAPFVARYGDRASWERLLELEAANNAASALRFRGALAEGFGRALGADDLGWLDARIRATEDLTLKTALVWAMLRALERC
jgi:hypothetical protein